MCPSWHPEAGNSKGISDIADQLSCQNHLLLGEISAIPAFGVKELGWSIICGGARGW
jgi:hypothetical protein